MSLKPGPLAGFENEEEFFAVLVPNIYISESQRLIPGDVKSLLKLRSDHGQNALLPGFDIDEVYLNDLKMCSQAARPQ